MRILAIGITLCLMFNTVCVSNQNDYNSRSLAEGGADIEKALDLIKSQNDYDAGIAAYKRGHYAVAFSNFESRAMEGDPVAQFCLGSMYKNHGGIAVTDRDLTEAEREVKSREETEKWYTKAADQGYLPAQNNLGVMYVRRYEESDHENLQAREKALEWFRKAADQRYPPAQFNLCIIVEHENTAMEWCTKAADQGYPPAQAHLGNLYYHGNGVDKNSKLAVKWFRAAAEQGDALAQNNLGICYATGFGVDKNLEESFSWSKKAAEQGDAAGQFATAINYMLGEGVDKNLEEAFKWYKKAAEQDHASAQNNLAAMYRDFAVQYKKEKDEKRSKYCAEMANRWYLRAAQLGSGNAQRNIGRSFETEKNEDGVPPNPIEAYYWYSLALKNKTDLEKSNIKNPVSEVTEACYRIEKSLKKENEKLINQIQQQVDNWKPKQLVAAGTGFYVDKNHILTNAHVVVWEKKPGNNRLYAYDEFHIPYRRVLLLEGIDLDVDLALLYDGHRKTDESENAVTATFRFLKDIEVGEKIVSFGYPQINSLSFEGNLTDGIISSPLMEITISRPEIGFQHTAPIQRGNSGGPILDVAGYVVGVSVSTLPDYFHLSERMGVDSPEIINMAQNINFAINSDVVMDFLTKNLKYFILSQRAELDTLLENLENLKKGISPSEEVITLQEIRAKAEKFTVPVLCFKNKKQEPMSVEEINISGLKK